MDNLSGSAVKALIELCERHGLRDAAIVQADGCLYLYATTGYLADGSPVVTLISEGTDVHDLRENVQMLVWAWGRK